MTLIEEQMTSRPASLGETDAPVTAWLLYIGTKLGTCPPPAVVLACKKTSSPPSTGRGKLANQARPLLW